VSVRVGRLRLAVGDGAGHEHRVRPIVARALHLLHERLGAEARAGAWSSVRVGALRVPVLRLDLRTTSDDGAAERMAEALHAALRRASAGGSTSGAPPAPTAPGGAAAARSGVQPSR
jgi:hypothetical protein